MAAADRPGVILFVKFKSELSADQLQARYRERMPEFRALPGLVQKYYVHDEAADEWSGVYVWDSDDSVDAFMRSELCRSIAGVYRVVGSPRIERLRVLDILREEG